MKRVLTAAVLIPLVLLLVFRGPQWLMTAVLAVLAYICLHEFLLLARSHQFQPPAAAIRLGVFLVFALYVVSDLVGIGGRIGEWDLALVILFLFLALGPLVLGTQLLRATDLGAYLPSLAVSLLGVIYIVIPLLLLLQLWISEFGPIYVSYLLVVVWVGDIAAYYSGRNFGSRKLAPAISPGKTWEGAFGSLVASVIVGTLILINLQDLHGWLTGIWAPNPSFVGWCIPPRPPLWLALAVTASINIAAQLGDLIESAMKRGAGVKDSGHLLPGHGGMLDRIDALLVAAPVAFLLLSFALSPTCS